MSKSTTPSKELGLFSSHRCKCASQLKKFIYPFCGPKANISSQSQECCQFSHAKYAIKSTAMFWTLQNPHSGQALSYLPQWEAVRSASDMAPHELPSSKPLDASIPKPSSFSTRSMSLESGLTMIYWVARRIYRLWGGPGYRVDFGLQYGCNTTREECFMNRPPKAEILRHMQWTHLQIGTQGGIRECDIVPHKRQTVLGPERPTYKNLVGIVEQMCDIFKVCHQIHCLRISVRSIEKTPGSIEKVMDPIQRLRGIKKSCPVVFAMQEDHWVDWNLKGSYGRYLNEIMALPEGTDIPKYVGDEKEPKQNDKNIFDMVGGKWLGGKTFVRPNLDGDNEADFGGDGDMDEEMDDLDDDAWVDDKGDDMEMFMNAMCNGNYGEAFDIANRPSGVGFPVIPTTVGHVPLAPQLLGTFIPPVGHCLHHHCRHHHHHQGKEHHHEMDSEWDLEWFV